MQVEEARALVYNLLNSEPARYETCLSRSTNYNSSSRLRIHSSFSIRFATGLITQIVAGHKIESDDDPYLRIAKAGLESMSRAGGAPGGSAVDFFPFREWIHLILPLLLSLASRLEVQYFPRWFPGTHYAAVADRWRPTVRELYEHSVRSVREKWASSRPNSYLGIDHSADVSQESGEAAPSFILSQLEEMETWDSVTGEDEEDLKGSAASMFAAGESTVSLCFPIYMQVQTQPTMYIRSEDLERAIRFHARDGAPSRMPGQGARGT